VLKKLLKEECDMHAGRLKSAVNTVDIYRSQGSISSLESFYAMITDLQNYFNKEV
jgi:hypothetical protein